MQIDIDAEHWRHLISGCTDERESVDDAKCNIVSIGLICYSYTMVRPPVRGDLNALASE